MYIREEVLKNANNKEKVVRDFGKLFQNRCKLRKRTRP